MHSRTDFSLLDPADPIGLSGLSFACSTLLHTAGIACLSVSLLERPRLVQAPSLPWSLQIISIDVPQFNSAPTPQNRTALASPFPLPLRSSHPTSAHTLRTQTTPSRPVLLQDTARPLQSEDLFIPSVLVFSPQNSSTAAQVTPHPPETPAIPRAHPSPDLPLPLLTVADLQIAPADTTSTKLDVIASSAALLATPESRASRITPQTDSEVPENSAPARLVSLSEFQPISARFPAPRVSSPVHPSTDSLSLSSTSLNPPSTPAASRQLHLPKDGRFATVLVGDGIADGFPEAASLWRGRLVYTVHLHVGLLRPWILQYAVARSASVTGPEQRPDAPWPTDMTVPALPDFSAEAEALLIHGLIDSTGNFQSLAMLLPPNFAGASFLLDCLRQWRFRPARQRSGPVPAEILLIIPAQD